MTILNSLEEFLEGEEQESSYEDSSSQSTPTVVANHAIEPPYYAPMRSSNTCDKMILTQPTPISRSPFPLISKTNLGQFRCDSSYKSTHNTNTKVVSPPLSRIEYNNYQLNNRISNNTNEDMIRPNYDRPQYPDCIYRNDPNNNPQFNYNNQHYASQLNKLSRNALNHLDENSYSYNPQFKANVLPAKLNVGVLPPSQRSVFSFEQFNQMQTQCFPSIYNSSNNCVISSPTGSGKTVLFELAILKEFRTASSETCNFKVLYLAPTKALCSERRDDWTKKFKDLNITVGMLTGDTSFKEADNVRKSNIIISTPEKWDMITRKWVDYKKLFGFIKLLLVDEIHILKESRGSTLEVVITRMKRICVGLRILAISATVANAHDISTWIKQNELSDLPAETHCFGEDYRAVKLDKIVYGYKPTSENDFQFDMILNSKLIEVINLHSKNKPVLIFCPTRNSSQATAKYLLANMNNHAPLETNLKLKDKELHNLVRSGMAYHHAGLVYADRKQIETAFLSGKIKYLCSTSTLAVGINLPAYLVIVKGTKCWADGLFKEYSETDILQMLGRAGRPQFEDEGVAVIMTTAKLKQKYERIVKGTEKIESSLHLNFPENLAAEISVGAIKNLEEALLWVKTTYLYVRFISNPSYYIPSLGIKCISPDEEETLLQFCRYHVDALLTEKLVRVDNQQIYHSTPYGYSMTMHYIMFGTMKSLIRSKPYLNVPDILDLLAKSSEFSDFKLKMQEKRLYKEINSSPLIRYPCKSKEMQHFDKLKLIIQFELGGLEFPNYTGAMKLHSSFLGDKILIFKQIHRIIMAMMDVFVEKKDSLSLKKLSYLYRCVNGRCWEDSPNELSQLDGVGLANMAKFVNHNILRLKDADELNSSQIEYFLGLKMGAGNKIKRNLQSIPRLSLELQFEREELEPSDASVKVTFSVIINISNPNACSSWKGKPVYIQVLTDTSNGKLLDFRRIPVFKFNNGDSKRFQVVASVTDLDCHLLCEASAENIASVKLDQTFSLKSKLSSETRSRFIQPEVLEFDDDFEFSDLEEEKVSNIQPSNRTDNTSIESQQTVETLNKAPITTTQTSTRHSEATLGPRRLLPNGNYECNHFCKDKLTCRHFCCREGLPPKNVPKASDHKQLQNKFSQNLQPNFIPNRETLGDRHEVDTCNQLETQKNHTTNDSDAIKHSERSIQLNPTVSAIRSSTESVEIAQNDQEETIEKVVTQKEPEKIKKNTEALRQSLFMPSDSDHSQNEYIPNTQVTNIPILSQRETKNSKPIKKSIFDSSDSDSDFGVLNIIKSSPKRKRRKIFTIASPEKTNAARMSAVTTKEIPTSTKLVQSSNPQDSDDSLIEVDDIGLKLDKYRCCTPLHISITGEDNATTLYTESEQGDIFPQLKDVVSIEDYKPAEQEATTIHPIDFQREALQEILGFDIDLDI